MGFGKDGKGAILRSAESVTLTTLAANSARIITNDIVLQEDFRMLKAEIFSTIEGLTAGEGDQLLFGIANGELSEAEIAECLVADGPVDRNDRLATERAERNVKLYSKYQKNASADTEAALNQEGSGAPLVIKHRWTYSNPEGWSLFVFNMGASALTTGATARTIGTYFGVWVT